MKLILVYNADEGIFNAATDTIHKVLSPSTYACRLCRYTFGAMGMLKKWKEFLNDLPMRKDFCHRDEFRREHPATQIELPAILIEQEGRMGLLVSAAEINACDNLDELISIVADRTAPLLVKRDELSDK